LEEYCGIVKYILFVSREIWPPFNSLYAYIKIKKEFPREVVLLYTDENIAQKIERKIKKLYQQWSEFSELPPEEIPSIDNLRQMSAGEKAKRHQQPDEADID